ncbi:MAG: hypothetical protein ABFC96_03670 [Thermoguttaceae bacterium]
MATCIRKAQLAHHHSLAAFLCPSFVPRLIVVVAALSAILSPVSHAGDGIPMDSKKGHRRTMIRFLGCYGRLAFLRNLPCPVRRAPVTEFLSYVNGDGKPLYSWRAELSNFTMTQDNWNEKLAWDSPVNRVLMWRDGCFAADSTLRPTEESVRRQKSFPQTVIMAIVGPGTAFGDNKKQTPLKGLPPSAVLLVESRASGIPWPAPGDFDIRTMPRTINAKDGKGISGQNPGGFVVSFADGQAWFISEKIPFETLEKFFTIEGAKKHNREKLLGPFALDRLDQQALIEKEADDVPRTGLRSPRQP